MKKQEFITIMEKKGYNLNNNVLSSGLHTITINEDDTVRDSNPAGRSTYESFDDFLNHKSSSFYSYGSLD